jgi:hypothetical protein
MSTFTGFIASDFGAYAGTNWRGPKRFGGVLARRLAPVLSRRNTRSWAVARKPEVHIGLRGRYTFRLARQQAKLFVYAHKNVNNESDRGEVAFGFQIERPDLKSSLGDKDWRTFSVQLAPGSPMATKLRIAMQEGKLILGDYYSRLGCQPTIKSQWRWIDHRFEVADGGVDTKWTSADWEEALGTLRLLTRNQWTNLAAYTVIPKEEAIGLRGEIEQRIVSVLESLAAVYDLATSTIST